MAVMRMVALSSISAANAETKKKKLRKSVWNVKKWREGAILICTLVSNERIKCVNETRYTKLQKFLEAFCVSAILVTSFKM